MCQGSEVQKGGGGGGGGRVVAFSGCELDRK